ncbi:hypothetical protein SCUP234_00018 [Seiridium cupressi]
MSLRRSGTRKFTGGTTNRAKGYEAVQQGVKVIHPHENSGIKPDIDIVFVPGLGANPEDSWKSSKTDWNWMTSADGLIRDFPRARVLLYLYESAWTGALKVKQFLSNISMALLVGLRSKREDCKKRPIVFIGHSMGGLVIAKAITILDSQPDLCPVMFEAVSVAVFFGTPFNGASVAAWASMYSYWAEKWNKATTSKLLDLMKPGDETLRELKDEFRRVAAKTRYKVELMCFWEEQPTDFTKIAGLPSLFGLTRNMIPKDVSEFVSFTSATFEGDVPKLGLASNHRDLVKFDGPKDERWNLVRDCLKKRIHGAFFTAKNRLSATRDIDWDSFKGVMEALGPAPIHRTRKVLAQNHEKSPLVAQEDEYQHWLEKATQRARPPGDAKVDGLWIRGPEGRGKAGAMLTTLDDVENTIKINEKEGGDPMLFAYFLCDGSTDYCTAEDLLRSILWQLIEQEKALTTHAKVFIKNKGKNDMSKSRATATIENLWKSLQGMLTDEFAGSRVYIVLSNIHMLPESSDSTFKFLNLLSMELSGTQSPEPSRVLTKWLITSRPTYAIKEALAISNVHMINLEDEKFGNQFQLTLRKHAKSKVGKLEIDKKYNKALAWFAGSLIGERAQNIVWIDITCLQLEELPEAESDLKVRRMLEAMPQELGALLKNAWLQIFSAEDDSGESIKEILRALILTAEEPTEDELAVLTGQSANVHGGAELRQSIEKCKLLVSINKTKTINFMNSVVKQHLIENSMELLGLSAQEMARQHGLLALRSLTYLKEIFDFPETDPPPISEDGDRSGSGAYSSDTDGSEGYDSGVEGELEYEDSYDGSGSSDRYDDWDEESGADCDPEADKLIDLKALSYMVKNWLYHGSKATVGFADDLSFDDEFWKPRSLIRRRWLVEYTRTTNDFQYDDPRTMNSLHIAASIGFRQLLVALIENEHADEINASDSMSNTPLCFAARFGRVDIVEELLDRQAEINVGEDEGEDTPLHLAAEEGHVEVMRKLILRGANLNAHSDYSGLVINSAICSGSFAAVELLVNHGVSLSLDRGDVMSPLEQAATLSDVSMLRYLMEKYTDQLPPEEYSKALISGAGAGRVEVFTKLLDFDYTHDDFQWALDEAADNGNWEIAKIILEKRQHLNCDNVFHQAATGTDDQEVLEALWEYTKGSISHDKIDESLYDAADMEKTWAVQLLLEKFGADPNAQGDEYGNALTASAYDGTLPIMKILLDHGADVNSPVGWALQTAATEGHVEVVRELLVRGANVNALASNSNFLQGTALQGACEFGREEIVDMLLAAGANPNLGGGEDAHPIITAAANCQGTIIGKLISAHADVNVVRGDDRSTPLIISAINIASVEPLQLLLDEGANIDATDGNGDTALIAAASVGDSEFVNFLLAKGADAMHTNDDGLSALHAAMDCEDDETMSVLINHVSTILSLLKTKSMAGDYALSRVIEEARATARRINQDVINEDGSDQHAAVTDHGLETNGSSEITAARQEARASINPIAEDEVSRRGYDQMPTTHDQESPATGFQAMPSDDYGYYDPPNSRPPVEYEPPVYNKDQELYTSQQSWRQTPDTDYNGGSQATQGIPRQSSDSQQRVVGESPSWNQGTPIRRKPAPVAYGPHASTTTSTPPSTASTMSTPPQMKSNYAAYNPETPQTQPQPLPGDHTSSSMSYNQDGRPFQTTSYPQPYSQVSNHAQDPPASDTMKIAYLHGNANQPQQWPDPAHASRGYQGQPYASALGGASPRQPRPQPVQAYSSPAQMQKPQPQLGSQGYHSMLPSQDPRNAMNPVSQYYPGMNQPHQDYPNASNPRPHPGESGFIGTIDQTRNISFSSYRGVDHGR